MTDDDDAKTNLHDTLEKVANEPTTGAAAWDCEMTAEESKSEGTETADVGTPAATGSNAASLEQKLEMLIQHLDRFTRALDNLTTSNKLLADSIRATWHETQQGPPQEVESSSQSKTSGLEALRRRHRQ